MFSHSDLNFLAHVTVLTLILPPPPAYIANHVCTKRVAQPIKSRRETLQALTNISMNVSWLDWMIQERQTSRSILPLALSEPVNFAQFVQLDQK